MKTNLLKTICVAAGVSAVFAASGTASLAKADDQAVHIRVDDLNLNSPEGHAAFESRLSRAADRFCQDQREPSANFACRRALDPTAGGDHKILVRREAVDFASLIQRGLHLFRP